MDALMQDLNKYVTNERRLWRESEAKLKSMVDTDLTSLEGYMVEQIGETNFILKHEEGGREEFLSSIR